MSPFNKLFHIVLSAVAILWISPGETRAEPQRVGPVQVELVSKSRSVQPGQPFKVGLRIIPDEDWHVYWKNPGDAGLPPTLKWTLPEGFTAGDIDYPAPSLITSGPLAAYGYHGEVLYPVTITPSDNLSPGDSITIGLKADWLVCRVECLPGSAELSVSLPVASERPEHDQSILPLFDKTARLQPQPLPNSWETQATIDGKTIYLDLRPDRKLPAPVELQFFVDEKAVIEHAAEQPFDEIDGLYRLRLTRSPYSTEKPETLSGVLAVTSGGSRNYYNMSVPSGSPPVGAAAAVTSEPGIGIGFALLFAFVGGLILNLMPCVLPVLSIKVLGLIGQANESRRSAINHGLLFTLGVVTTFWAIVGTMLILQAGGQQLGWGFQLQSPTFVMILAAFMFLFALSLFGLFEINLFSAGAASQNSKHSGGGGAFLSGITATLVATPCTAPFMGAALGFTLTQPAVMSLLIYTVLGLGMASPYLILSAFPNLLRFVPKPGRWMETLKQAMGFLLAATVIWLAWLLSSLAGATALVALLGVLLLVSIAAWVYGRWGTVVSAAPVRWTSRVIAVVLICVSLVAGNTGMKSLRTDPDNRSTQTPSEGIAWEKYSDAYLSDLLARKRSVFIDFTADWCLSCQVNERVAFSSDKVQDRFKELDIVPLVADWTHRSDEIAQALARFGRNSVPLYVLYRAGDESNPILLPEILTPGIVLDALQNIENEPPPQEI